MDKKLQRDIHERFSVDANLKGAYMYVWFLDFFFFFLSSTLVFHLGSSSRAMYSISYVMPIG